jgi:2-O-methyltransferase
MMNLATKFKIKIRSLWLYYLFQRLGFPAVKREQISKSVLKKYLPENPIIIDCGAHDGSDSVELAKILNGTIHSFEPVQEIYSRLKRNTASYSNIITHNLALSDETKVQYFYVSEGHSDASSSLLKPKDHLIDHPGTTFKKKIEVQAMTLDDWAATNNVMRVNMLWLDMQGFEYQMLKASRTILDTVSVIHSEVSTKQTYENVKVYTEYKSFLESKGFKVVLEAIPEGWDMGNVLFVRK